MRIQTTPGPVAGSPVTRNSPQNNGPENNDPKQSWLERQADRLGSACLPAVDFAATRYKNFETKVHDKVGGFGQAAYHVLRNGALGATYALAGALGGAGGVALATASGAGVAAVLARADGTDAKDTGVAAEAGSIAGFGGAVIGAVAGPAYGSAIAGGIGAFHSLMSETLGALGA